MKLGTATPWTAEAVTADRLGLPQMPGWVLTGWRARETASAAAQATMKLLIGTDATGRILDHVELAPNESARDYFDPPVELDRGIFIDWVAGELAVTFLVAPKLGKV